MNKLELFTELIERSQNETRGLTVYINGQQITGIVTKIIDKQAIEMRSQQYHKSIVLIEAIEAMTVN